MTEYSIDMKELLLPVSSSKLDWSIFNKSDQRFNFVDGTVCRVATDITDRVGVWVYRHPSGQLTEELLDQDVMIAEQPPGRSEEKFSRNLAWDAAWDLEKRTGENVLAIMERMDPSFVVDLQHRLQENL